MRPNTMTIKMGQISPDMMTCEVCRLLVAANLKFSCDPYEGTFTVESDQEVERSSSKLMAFDRDLRDRMTRLRWPIETNLWKRV